MVGSGEITDDLRRLRREHNEPGLHRTDLLGDPFDQFAIWMRDAIAAQLELANSMTLATASKAGRPSARVVLLKGIDNGGFVFFTNYGSKKARDLDENPWASLVFYWSELSRQVRVEGRVERVSDEDSAEYFATRSRGSRIGAWASNQSEIIPDRSVLDEAVARYAREFADDTIPRPPHWGGYRLIPDRFEFWQGRPSRLHDRFLYEPATNGAWTIDRLSP